MDHSPPGSSVHGILQARILELVATSFSRGPSRPLRIFCVSCAGRQILYLGSPGVFKRTWTHSPTYSTKKESRNVCKYPCSQSPTPVFHHSLGNTFQKHHDHRQTDYSLKQKLPPVTTRRNVTHSPPPHQKVFS